MAEVTTVTGMILSAMPVGEYDRRLVILTKEYGKITVFAKGARKPNSALIGVTRSFIFGTFEVYRGRESYTMYKASAKEYFENVVMILMPCVMPAILLRLQIIMAGRILMHQK